MPNKETAPIQTCEKCGKTETAFDYELIQMRIVEGHIICKEHIDEYKTKYSLTTLLNKIIELEQRMATLEAK